MCSAAEEVIDMIVRLLGYCAGVQYYTAWDLHRSKAFQIRHVAGSRLSNLHASAV